MCVCDSLRYYIARYQQERLVGRLSETLKKVQMEGFEVLAIEPRLVNERAMHARGECNDS